MKKTTRIRMVFITDARKEILKGHSDWSENAIINEKSLIRNKSRTALDELITVARSNQIENRSVFDPEQVGMLLFWILNDPAMIEDGGLIGADDDAPDEAKAAIPERLQQYRQSVHSEAAQELLKIDHPERGR